MLASASASRSRALKVGITTTARTRNGTIRECVVWSCGRRTLSEHRWPGPGIRYHRLATELSKQFDVTLVGPGDEGVGSAPYAYRPAAEVKDASGLPADVVVAQRLPLALARACTVVAPGSSTTCTSRR